MRYQIFSLVVILLGVSTVWSPQLLVAQTSPSPTENLNNADLLEAARYGQTEKVLDLIKAGADVNAKNNYGDTALILAVRYNYTKMVHLLKSAGAKENP